MDKDKLVNAAIRSSPALAVFGQELHDKLMKYGRALEHIDCNLEAAQQKLSPVEEEDEKDGRFLLYTLLAGDGEDNRFDWEDMIDEDDEEDDDYDDYMDD
ncbi:oxidoreductase family protein [Apiospora arundinis]